MPTLDIQGQIWTLDLGADENRFSPSWLDAADALLDQVEAATAPVALVTTGSGKFFSNGLDVGWLTAHPDELGSYVQRAENLFSRVLTLPVPTVAVVNGHAFGAGAMLALAHDFRIMRTDRGYFCFPEVDIGLPFTPGMTALITAKVSARTALTSMTTGRRYTGPAALKDGLVDGLAGADELAGAAATLIGPLAGKDPATLGTIKRVLFAHVTAALVPPGR